MNITAHKMCYFPYFLHCCCGASLIFLPTDASIKEKAETAAESEERSLVHKIKNLYLAKIPLESLNLIKTVEQCLKGHTQNPNESFHSKIWKKVSKDKFSGFYRVKFTCESTILEHNFGYTLSSFALRLGFPNSEHTYNSLDRKE